MLYAVLINPYIRTSYTYTQRAAASNKETSYSVYLNIISRIITYVIVIMFNWIYKSTNCNGVY